jgi:hypothetical protein
MIFSLRSEPLHGYDLFFHFHTSERVELLVVGLELCEVVELAGSLLLVLPLEDDDPSGLIPDGKIVARVIELEEVDDVLLKDFFVGALVAEDLCEFVGASFAGVFLHSSIGIR